MTDRRTLLAVGLLSAFLIVGAVGLPTVASGAVANQIPVEHAPGKAGQLSAPTGAAWQDVESVTVPLSSAPSGLPNAADVSTSTVHVRAARTDTRLFVRLRWADASRNTTPGGPREFADGAAMQVPVDTSTHPAIALGGKSTPVNVWYWNAKEGPDEILAGGPGTITTIGHDIGSHAEYADGQWTLVLSRNLTVAGENRTEFRMNHDVDAAFAVWNGANEERSGHHAVSAWYHYPLGPEPQGPPFASLLWTVVGIAVVIAILVTAMAVRRGE